MNVDGSTIANAGMCVQATMDTGSKSAVRARRVLQSVSTDVASKAASLSKSANPIAPKGRGPSKPEKADTAKALGLSKPRKPDAKVGTSTRAEASKKK